MYLLILYVLFHKIDYLFRSAKWNVPLVLAVFEIHNCIKIFSHHHDK